MAKVTKSKRKKKKSTVKKSSGSFLGFLIKLILILLVLGIGGLKHLGINNLDDFKVYARKNPKLRKLLGLKPPVDHLALAENAGKKILKSIVEKEKYKKDARKTFQMFLDHKKKKEYSKAYKMFSSDDHIALQEDDYIFSKKGEIIEWKDPVINQEFKTLVDGKYSEVIKDIIIKGKQAEIIVQTSYVKVSEHLPDSKDIPKYYELSESDVEKASANIVLEKLRSGGIPTINKKLIHYMIFEDTNGWRIINSKGTKEFTKKKAGK